MKKFQIVLFTLFFLGTPLLTTTVSAGASAEVFSSVKVTALHEANNKSKKRKKKKGYKKPKKKKFLGIFKGKSSCDCPKH